MNFLVYKQNTGQIVRWGTCFPDDLHGQARPGEAVIEGRGTSATHWFDLDTRKLRELPAKPSAHHLFDFHSKQWIDPRTPETEWVVVRQLRDSLLGASDFTQLPDSPKNRQAWAAYRQGLRDLTQQPDPFNLTWPAKPTT